MTTDIDKLRELAVKARDAGCTGLSPVSPRDFISILDALESANAKVKDLETVNSNLKSDIRRGRQIIADLEEYQE